MPLLECADDLAALHTHMVYESSARWRRAADAAGAFGCVLSLSLEGSSKPHAAMIELYFPTAGADRGDGWARLETACAGGARGEWESKWVDPAQTVVLKTTTEFVAFERSR